jgi:argininosuccinate synthase
MTPRIVVAYGGSLESAAAFAVLGARLGADIATLTLDLGQGAELEQVRAQALSAGARRAHVVDARRELAGAVIRPALAAGAFEPSPLALEVTRPVIVRHLVEVARMEGAGAVAHGAVGEDRRRIERLIAALAPGLIVHALADEEVPAAGAGQVAQHLWARTVVVPDRRGGTSPDVAYARTAAPASLAAHPAVVRISLEGGVPTAVNGVGLELDALIEVIDTIAGDHGVGRFETVGGDCRSLVEAPAAVVLGAAVRELAAVTLAPGLQAVRAQAALAYHAVLSEGDWHSPTREALDAFTGACASALTGTVALELAHGECRVVECVAGAAPAPLVAYS